MSLPDCYMMVSPQLPEKSRNAIKKLHLFLDDMAIPFRLRSDFRWLRLNLHRRNKDHKNYEKVMLLLKYLTGW